jgi:hypothetical protein
VNLTSRDFHKSLIGNVDTQRQRVDEAWPYLQPPVELIVGAANAADCGTRLQATGLRQGGALPIHTSDDRQA